MSFRIEKKFKLTKSEQIEIKNNLRGKGMKSLYPKRNIYSCYFDTKNLKCFLDSEEGILPKKN